MALKHTICVRNSKHIDNYFPKFYLAFVPTASSLAFVPTCLFGIRAYGEYSCTVRVWHFILVVHIHSLAAIVVLLSENAL